jgi:hypothetical protein
MRLCAPMRFLHEMHKMIVNWTGCVCPFACYMSETTDRILIKFGIRVNIECCRANLILVRNGPKQTLILRETTILCNQFYDTRKEIRRTDNLYVISVWHL